MTTFLFTASIYYSKPITPGTAKNTLSAFNCDGILISGDVHVEFFNKKFTQGLMFSFWFHTQFIANDYLVLKKADLDKGICLLWVKWVTVQLLK